MAGPRREALPTAQPFAGCRRINEEKSMLALLGLLLVVWVVCIVVGIAVKGLFWLLIIGAVLFVGTAAIGFVKREALGRGKR
ncbi:hypothetical protein ACFPN7_25675 [Amycolatopsis halotolerans]